MINEQYIATHGLKECLYAFRGAGDGSIEAKELALKTEFYHLAQKMLYGGFLQVGDDYEIYIRTVEFYYYEEEESKNQIQDPIVYHRNGRFPGRDLPPFPMMSLHAHWSGYDITFEEYIDSYEIGTWYTYDGYYIARLPEDEILIPAELADSDITYSPDNTGCVFVTVDPE